VCVCVLNACYAHISIKDLEINYCVQCNAEVGDPVVIYCWCVVKCPVVIIATYIVGSSVCNSVDMTEK
jgi:hypothetical protein